jgi:hypothetical protein
MKGPPEMVILAPISSLDCSNVTTPLIIPMVACGAIAGLLKKCAPAAWRIGSSSKISRFNGSRSVENL